MALSGLLVLTVPEIRATSPTVAVLPLWTAGVWGAVLLVGGLMSAYGMLRRRPDFESSGMALLGSGQLVALITSISALGLSAAALGVVLRGGLAIGCLLRALTLAQDGPR